MKKLLIIAILFFGCMNPEDPIIDEEILPTVIIPTIGFCRDVDIRDSILVAANDENGYMVVSINENLDFEILYEAELDPLLHADRVKISDLYNYFLVLDVRDVIVKVDFADFSSISSVLPSPDSENRPDDTRSFVIDETDPNLLRLYSLWIENDHSEIYKRNYWYEDISNPDSIVFFDFLDANSHQDFYNSNAQELYLSDSLLSIANSQLGVIVLRKDGNGDLTELSRFDTPLSSEVETVFSVGNIIFSGLSYNGGCYAVELDLTTGEVADSVDFASGYSVNGIYGDENLIVLACGYDGVLLYRWNSDLNNVEFVAKLVSQGYAYKVKLEESNVFVATRNGIEIFEIER
ncbi:MAG: hypothetical protein ISR90_03930 [Candidatus Marinimicrobia bacterium]|nr:hypothetical protein [Candidatus Neomarinimicrobiota bacterium]MBL7023189.1 hypothetical protein [Candidatus Neomarinimicrobiota bacterium]MBL7109244.1 hypothetical protein [Candidatus Neomarinimicrobiota bacterium]